MDECTLDKTMSCAVATACLKKVCKCGFKIPSRAVINHKIAKPLNR